MTKRVFKYVFLLLYFLAGVIISYFLPAGTRYMFGYLLSLMASWTWSVLNIDRKEGQHG
ncbi:hypothetical protein [Chryseosolibacter indicus]|uniref:Uncharacterized protein n=1 Tax=Chryseosolibacter indicus TaxID=2782351 RepID=A0ABS5VN95_9BACT|nr:hypothetical protein [Chryseosolibacter indicus]MBT1702930.1 hypothetical protein [Chryseosolibacter indicus]